MRQQSLWPAQSRVAVGDVAAPADGPAAAPAPVRLAGLRILEIGDHYYFKAELPRQTELLWTGRKPPALSPRAYVECTPRNLIRALGDARKGRYDVVVAYPTLRSPWHPRHWLRSLARSPARPIAAIARVFGVWLLRFARIDLPLVAIDMHDAFTISRSSFFLLDRASFYFKRELPTDLWQVLYGTAHPNLPTHRIRRSAQFSKRIAKLRPISIGVAPVDIVDIESIENLFESKTVDVFFSGLIDGQSTIREIGSAQLRRLAELGIRVDMPTERLSRSEYYRRMSRAWLAWSPAGFGWECYRHYEAALCLAVPVMNYPTIWRHRPLRENVHAIYYAPEENGLFRAVVSALDDRRQLKRMACAAREHVLAHHTVTALCERVLRAATVGEELAA